MRKPKPRIVCHDKRHADLCWLPCRECRRECDKRKQRPATPEEEAQIQKWLADGTKIQ